jgi:hypothetical protein
VTTQYRGCEQVRRHMAQEGRALLMGEPAAPNAQAGRDRPSPSSSPLIVVGQDADRNRPHHADVSTAGNGKYSHWSDGCIFGVPTTPPKHQWSKLYARFSEAIGR